MNKQLISILTQITENEFAPRGTVAVIPPREQLLSLNGGIIPEAIDAWAKRCYFIVNIASEGKDE